MPPDRRRVAVYWLIGLAIGGVVALAIHGPIPQPDEYHAFADARPWLGIPNAANVLSNLPFLAIGLAGIAAVARSRRDARPPEPWERSAFAAYAGGIALTAVGSVVYHLHPSNASLVADRLPMAFAFSAFSALLVGERLSPRAGRLALVPLLVAGLLSVAIWAISLSGAPGGDLRAYVFVKFTTLVLAVVLLPATREPVATRGPVWLSLVTFGIATAFEFSDEAVYRATGGAVSGHTLKHLVAALSAAFLLTWYSRRRAR